MLQLSLAASEQGCKNSVSGESVLLSTELVPANDPQYLGGGGREQIKKIFPFPSPCGFSHQLVKLQLLLHHTCTFSF